MKQCVNEVVAFGLNQVELDLISFVVVIALGFLVGRWLILYCNQDIKTKEE